MLAIVAAATWGARNFGFQAGASAKPAPAGGATAPTATTAPPPAPDKAAEAAIRDVEIATAATVEGADAPVAPDALGSVCGPLLGLAGRLAGVAATYPQYQDRVGVLSETVTSVVTERRCQPPPPGDAATVPAPGLCVGEPAAHPVRTAARTAGPDSGVTVVVLEAPVAGTVGANITRIHADLRLTNTGGKAVEGPVTVLATVGDAKGDTVVVGGGPKDVDLGAGRSTAVTVDVVGACKGSKVSIRVGAASSPPTAFFTAP